MFSKCHSQRVEDWVGRRCFTVWVYLRNQLKKKKHKKNRGTLRKVTQTNRFYMLCFVLLFNYFFFIRWVGTLLDSELWLCWKIHELFSRSFCVLSFLYKSYWPESERAHWWWSVWAFIGITESHKHPQSMDPNGLKFRAMQGPYTESSFEMYIQCEGLKWFFFLLNSIFYRFCRHFVVGWKNKRNFMGAYLPSASVAHTDLQTDLHILVYKIK